MIRRTGSRLRRPRVADRGLQLERTALAWQRTALALLVANLACVRFAVSALNRLTPIAGAAAIAVAAAVLLAVLWLLLGRWSRDATGHRSWKSWRDRPAGGRLPAATALLAGLLAVSGAVVVATGTLPHLPG